MGDGAGEGKALTATPITSSANRHRKGMGMEALSQIFALAIFGSAAGFVGGAIIGLIAVWTR